jgi:hypothetical protein
MYFDSSMFNKPSTAYTLLTIQVSSFVYWIGLNRVIFPLVTYATNK